MRTSGVAVFLLFAGLQSAWAQPAQRPVPARGAAAPVRHGVAVSRPAAPSPRTTPTPSPLPRPEPPRPAQQRQDPPTSPFDAGPFTYAPRYRPWQRPKPPYYWGSGYYGYGAPYEFVEAPSTGERRDSSNDQLSLDGTLFLEVEPRAAEVYVDGFYVGTSDDLAQTGLALRAGRHWIDLRAAGYDTLTVPVMIIAEQPVRYRGGLTRARSAAAIAEPASGPQTLYVITGCYAGNRPPVESGLPPDCDISQLRVLNGPR
jgi:hypothetical protein